MSKAVLIVDDDEAIGKMLSRLLQNEGYSTKRANDGQEGLEAYNEDTFDLVITDIIMPDMEGIEFIISLKRHNPDVKIIAISGGGYLSAHNYLETAKDFGIIGSFAKPFDTKALLNKVNEVLF